MVAKITVHADVDLEYDQEVDELTGVKSRWTADPPHADELEISVYPDDNESFGVPDSLCNLGRLQVQLNGSARALETFGRYLIALGRLETTDADLHDHFEDIAYTLGGTVHLIVRRTAQEQGP